MPGLACCSTTAAQRTWKVHLETASQKASLATRPRLQQTGSMEGISLKDEEHGIAQSACTNPSQRAEQPPRLLTHTH